MSPSSRSRFSAVSSTPSQTSAARKAAIVTSQATASTRRSAIGKARTAARFRRPTKVLEEAVAGGRTVLLALDGVPLEGGLPIVVDGRVIGAVGVSGVTSQQDAQVAQAAIDALVR